MPITFSSHQTVKDANKNNYIKVYAANVGYGNYSNGFTRKGTGFFAGESTNTIEKTLDSTKFNALEWRGYIRLGNGFNLGNVIKGIGRYIVPETNEQDFDRSASYRFNNHVKICSTSQFTPTRDNKGIRYLPNKRKPISIDLYPFRSLINLTLKNSFGSYAKALKADILKESSNQLAMYLGRKETVYLDIDGNYRNKVDGSYTHPPELTYYNGYDMAFQNNQPFTDDYRRKVANFGYYGVNQETIIYEDDPNAANIWMNKQLGTTNKIYNVNSVTEEFYQEETLYGELLEKYFENVDTENLKFEYKNNKYYLNGSTIYNENNEEVLGIELDNGNIFSFDYEKYIAYGLKDKVKPYINSFINYIKNKTVMPYFNSKFYRLGWSAIDQGSDYAPGEHGSSEWSWKTRNEINIYSMEGNVNDDYNKGETTGTNKPNYLLYKSIIEAYNGKYNSYNLFSLEQLVDVNTDYQPLVKDKLTQIEDEISKNKSYENSFFNPIMAMNYIEPVDGGTGYYRYNGSTTSYTYGYPGGFVYKMDGNTVKSFKDSNMCPYGYYLAKFYYDQLLGYDHSNTTEDYMYMPKTNKLLSVLDNYLGYEGEGGQIVYQYDENGNVKTEIIINEDGSTTEVPLIDEEKTIYPTLADIDSASLLSRRVFKSFNKYPKLVDFNSMTIKDSNVNIHTLTYNEISRKELDNNLTITVEALFQIKELEYNIGTLAYSKIVEATENKMSIEYENNFKFCPLIYAYDTEEFNSFKWSSVPDTKKYEFKFCNDVITSVDKIGKAYVAIEYEVDNETKILKLEDININSVKLALSGNKSRKGFIKSLPQVFVAQGKTRLYAKEEPSYLYQNFFLTLFIGAWGVMILEPLKKLLPSKTFQKKIDDIWWNKIYATMSARRDMGCESIGYSPRQTGDYFYNIGNKWTYIYHKCRAEKLHLWDKFENPGYSMKVLDRKNEIKIKLNPPAARIDSDRDFKQKETSQYNIWTGENKKVGLGYLERPFAFNALSTDEINATIGKKSRFKGNYTEREKEALKAKNLEYIETAKYKIVLQNPYTKKQQTITTGFIDKGSYKTSSGYTKISEEILEESYRLGSAAVNKFEEYNNNTSSITHIYQGQKFSMTFMLNNNFRRVQHLIKLAYIYCKYLCDVNGINNSRKTISVTLSHRLPMYYFKKNLKLDRRELSSIEISLMDKNFESTMIGDWLWLYNKKEKTKIGFDFKTYIPDYKSHYGVDNSNTLIIDNLIPKFKKLYNKEKFTEKEYKTWNTFYDNNINKISADGLYLNVPKLNIANTTNHMETFLREFFSQKTNEELLQIYNEEMNTSYTELIDTDSSSKKSLDINGELNRFINNETTNEINNTTTVVNLHTNKFFHQKISGSISEPKSQNVGGLIGNIKWVSTYNNSFYNSEITYDIRNLCMLYQIELEKIFQGTADSYTEDELSKIQNSFYTYIDSEINTITKRDVIDLIISKCQNIIPKQDYYLTISEFNMIISSTNKYALMLEQDTSSSNSLLYQLWIGYYVVPNDITSVVEELTNDGVTWATILEKDATITRGIDHDPMYISPYLPMYVDVYKRIPYNMRVFISQYAYTYDILSETYLIKKNNSYEAKLVKVFTIWSGLFIIWLAAIIAIAMYAATPFTGGASAVLATLLIISVVSTVLSAICMTIGAYTNNPKWIKAAKIFQVIAAVTGLIYGSAQSFTLEALKNMTGLQIGLAVAQSITQVVTVYHSFQGHTKDAAGWQIASMIIGMARQVDNAKSSISNKQMTNGQIVSFSINLLNQILDITNQITKLIQENKLESIADKIKELEAKNRELEQQLEKEKDEYAQEVNPFIALNSTNPVSLIKYDNAIDNILPTFENTLTELNTDNIIEAQFEVLET